MHLNQENVLADIDIGKGNFAWFANGLAPFHLPMSQIRVIKIGN